MSSLTYSPDYSHVTGLLKHLNDEELTEILNSDDQKITLLLGDLKQLHDITAEREMLMASNKSLSEYNLSQQPILERHHKQVEETRMIAINLKDSLIEKKKKIENSLVSTSNETLLALLQAATAEKESEAEAAVDTFLQNETSVDDFLQQYLNLKKTAHLRRIKAEKLTNILMENGSRVTSPPTKPNRLRKPPPPPNNNSTGIPYPPAAVNPVVPSRHAPLPPPAGNLQPAYPVYGPYAPTAAYPQPFPNQVRPPGAAPYGYYNPYTQQPRYGYYK